ncbi:hypothetical protein [Prosthecobacter dejongeii]|uniref:Uncharacterized protein n=1 Tax=Prosthecobacter dejongeii TaxID=48465 RepID=A0A7W8DPG7_9BACT|nr:hypothetical protein [Prosthecobacter dejongeii]MBB5037307.1 hypothetical protein [Prosthecobacter dejongeii]
MDLLKNVFPPTLNQKLKTGEMWTDEEVAFVRTGLMRRLAELCPDYDEFIQMKIELSVEQTVKVLHMHFGAEWNFETGEYEHVPGTLTEEDEWWMSGAQAQEHFFFQRHIRYHVEPPFADWPREDYWIKAEALNCVFYFARDTWWREVGAAEEPHIRELLDETLKDLNQAKPPYGGYGRHDTHQIIAKKMMEQKGLCWPARILEVYEGPDNAADGDFGFRCHAATDRGE